MRSSATTPTSRRINQRLSSAGQARCTCGALLGVALGPSKFEVKCRRCASIVTFTLEAAQHSQHD